MNIEQLVRPDLIGMKAYSSARDEFEGTASVFLDANENPNDNGVNRYPDPLQKSLKAKLASLKGTNPENLFLGNGSDECIDLLFRLFCSPGIDKVAAMSPSYGMYSVSARINNVELKEIVLNEDFTFPTDRFIEESKGSKLLFLCSPNNPTAFSIPRKEITRVVENFLGIVVLDEAYIDFAKEPGLLGELEKYPNLVICQTLSKAFGLAGIRLGLLFGSKEIISWLNKIKPPYNVNQLTQQFALDYLNNWEKIQSETAEIISERKVLEIALAKYSFVEEVFPSDANFILVRVNDANKLYQYLINRGIVVRNRSTQPLCQNTLRFTVGTAKENQLVLEALNQYEL
jgi:histidinol-phosphate aminotransferase